MGGVAAQFLRGPIRTIGHGEAVDRAGRVFNELERLAIFFQEGAGVDKVGWCARSSPARFRAIVRRNGRLV